LKINDGVPKDDRYVDSYLEEQSKSNSLFVQWLEDFKSKFGEYTEAQPTIVEVEEALKLYKDAVGKVAIPLAIDKARKARKPDSIFEYGMTWHLEKFLNKVPNSSKNKNTQHYSDHRRGSKGRPLCGQLH
jgi:hypothetical protein